MAVSRGKKSVCSGVGSVGAIDGRIHCRVQHRKNGLLAEWAACSIIWLSHAESSTSFFCCVLFLIFV